MSIARGTITRLIRAGNPDVILDFVLAKDYDALALALAEADRTIRRLHEATLELRDERDAARRWAAAWKRVACAAWMNLSRYHGNTHDRLMARFFVRNADHRLRERRCTAKKAKE